MTRINCIPVEELNNKMLLSEYRELPRVFKLARPCPDAPSQYVLGPGHVKFFFDKLKYLQQRQKQIVQECLNRGFNITHTSVDFDMPSELANDWIPTPEAMALNRARIVARLLVSG